MRDRPIVVRPDEATPGPATPGMERRELFAEDDRWAGWIRDRPRRRRVDHHGSNDSYIYVLRGSLTIDFGPGGRERVTATARDFIFNPTGLVHRDAAPESDAEAFLVRVGGGPQLVNVEGPDPG